VRALIDKDDGAEDLLPEEVVANHVRLHHLVDLKSKSGYLAAPHVRPYD